MGIQAKQATTFYPMIDTEFDMFKEESNFALEITNLSSGAVVTNDATGTFAEVMWTDPGHSATVNGAVSAGANQIAVDSGTNFVAGDRFDDGAGNIYYITKVANDIIYIKGELVADIADDASLSSVGNTGLYKVDVQLADAGNYLLSFSHPEMGHNAIKYEIVEHDTDDVYDRVDSGLNALGASKTFKVFG